MHGTYEQNKASAIRWREKNKDTYNGYFRKYTIWKNIKKEFLAILLV